MKRAEPFRTEISSDGRTATFYFRFCWPRTELEALLWDEDEHEDEEKAT